MYGVSISLACLWIRSNKNFEISAVIDNDVIKNGHSLKDFFDEDDLKNTQNVKISSKDILNQFNPDEVVILISSLNHYNEIALELEKK